MSIAISRISDLIIRHLKEDLTVEEDHELQGWVHNSPENLALFHQLTDADTLARALKEAQELRMSIGTKIDTIQRCYPYPVHLY